MTADELRKILEGMPFKGGGAEGAMWAVGKILDKLQAPKPRFIEGISLDFRDLAGTATWKISFPIEAIESCQEFKFKHKPPTTIVKLFDGTKVDVNCEYTVFMEKLNATNQV